ncbi:hypothetical protein SEPCBS119000_006275 [Sporothrix epigloea]|uniref:DEUBAD domain-containing protein n=1 Tax=Sporothrix epigloea TaxID=1892477 RepID=A0ABP0E2I3_9PEZI
MDSSIPQILSSPLSSAIDVDESDRDVELDHSFTAGTHKFASAVPDKIPQPGHTLASPEVSPPRHSHRQHSFQLAGSQDASDALETPEIVTEIVRGTDKPAAGQDELDKTQPAFNPQIRPQVETPEPESQPTAEPVLDSKIQLQLRPTPDPEPQPESAIIAALSRPSHTRNTDDAFTFGPQTSPKEDAVGDLDKGENVGDKKEESSFEIQQRDLKGEKQEKSKAGVPVETNCDKVRRKPGRPKKTAVSSLEHDKDSSSSTPAVTTTRSGRRVLRTCHYGESQDKPTSRKTSAKVNPPARAAAKVATTATAASKTIPIRDTTETPKTVRRGRPPLAAERRRRQLAAARWQTDFVLSNTRSPLAQFDLRTLLCRPEAWALLDNQEKREVLALFPPDTKVLDAGTVDARPDVASLKNDNNFRHDCARYRSGLQDGFFDTAWLEEAFEAHAMRQAGVFDEYVLEAFESSWGVKIPSSHKPEETGEVTVNDHQGQEGEDFTTSRKRSWDICVKADTEISDSTIFKDVAKLDNKPDTILPADSPEEEDRIPKRQKQDTEGLGIISEDLNEKAEEGVASGPNGGTIRCQDTSNNDLLASMPAVDTQQLPPIGTYTKDEASESREMLATGNMEEMRGSARQSREK